MFGLILIGSIFFITAMMLSLKPMEEENYIIRDYKNNRISIVRVY